MLTFPQALTLHESSYTKQEIPGRLDIIFRQVNGTIRPSRVFRGRSLGGPPKLTSAQVNELKAFSAGPKKGVQRLMINYRSLCPLGCRRLVDS